MLIMRIVVALCVHFPGVIDYLGDYVIGLPPIFFLVQKYVFGI